MKGTLSAPALAAAATLLLAGMPPPAAAQPPAASAADAPAAVTLPPALDRVLRDYEAAWRAGDGQRLASLFTPDGFAIQSGSPLARGRDAIAANIRGPGGTLQLTAYAYETSGTIGYIVGGFRYPQTVGPGGRFVLALRMGPDGRWLIAADLDNSGPRPRP
jgi:ketosteroid isomerase-like protein